MIYWDVGSEVSSIRPQSNPSGAALVILLFMIVVILTHACDSVMLHCNCWKMLTHRGDTIFFFPVEV